MMPTVWLSMGRGASVSYLIIAAPLQRGKLSPSGRNLPRLAPLLSRAELRTQLHPTSKPLPFPPSVNPIMKEAGQIIEVGIDLSLVFEGDALSRESLSDLGPGLRQSLSFFPSAGL